MLNVIMIITNDNGDGRYDDAGDDDRDDNYGTPSFRGNQPFWYTMFQQFNDLFPLLCLMNCIERKFKLDIQFAYIHRNSAQP